MPFRISTSGYLKSTLAYTGRLRLARLAVVPVTPCAPRNHLTGPIQRAANGGQSTGPPYLVRGAEL